MWSPGSKSDVNPGIKYKSWSCHQGQRPEIRRIAGSIAVQPGVTVQLTCDSQRTSNPVRSGQRDQKVVIVTIRLRAPGQDVSCVEVKMKSAHVPARQKLECVIGLARSQPFCRTRGWDLGRIADCQGWKGSALMHNSPLRSNQIVANSILAVAASALAGDDGAV